MSFQDAGGPMAWLEPTGGPGILPIEDSKTFWVQLAALAVLGVVVWTAS